MQGIGRTVLQRKTIDRHATPAMDMLTGAAMTRGSGQQASRMEKSLLGIHMKAKMSPVVILVTTPAVESFCSSLGLRSFSDILSPLCEFRNLNSEDCCAL